MASDDLKWAGLGFAGGLVLIYLLSCVVRPETASMFTQAGAGGISVSPDASAALVLRAANVQLPSFNIPVPQRWKNPSQNQLPPGEGPEYAPDSFNSRYQRPMGLPRGQ